MLPEDEISLAMWKELNLPAIEGGSLFFLAWIYEMLLRSFQPPISARGGGVARHASTTSDAFGICLLWRVNISIVASLCVRDSEATFAEMWVEQRGNIQPPLCNTSITTTRLSLNIAQNSLPYKGEH